MYYDSFAEVCLLLQSAAQVSDVAHGPYLDIHRLHVPFDIVLSIFLLVEEKQGFISL